MVRLVASEARAVRGAKAAVEIAFGVGVVFNVAVREGSRRCRLIDVALQRGEVDALDDVPREGKGGNDHDVVGVRVEAARQAHQRLVRGDYGQCLAQRPRDGHTSMSNSTK